MTRAPRSPVALLILACAAAWLALAALIIPHLVPPACGGDIPCSEGRR